MTELSQAECERALRDALDAADWLIICLKGVIQKQVVRGLPEAESGYYHSRSKALAAASPQSDHKRVSGALDEHPQPETRKAPNPLRSERAEQMRSGDREPQSDHGPTESSHGHAG